MKKNLVSLMMVLVLGTTFILGSTHKAVIFGAYVVYKSSSEITVTAGSGRCNDTFWEITSEIDVDLTGVLPAGEDFLYIYIDDSTSSYPTPTIIGSTTEPSWSNSKIGWYNGNDRCIGVVWCDSYGNILQFQNNSNLECITYSAIKQVLQNGNPNGTYQTVECTAYIPVNATAVRILAMNRESDDNKVYVKVAAYENTTGDLRIANRHSSAYLTGWILLERGWGRDLMWYGDDNDNNEFCIYIRGFRIER
jgi:hypothetical protein